jgi:hypothetical protein
MTQVPSQGPVIEVRPQPNIYTVLLLVAILVLLVAIGVVLWKLTSPMPNGYDMRLVELFKPFEPPVR